MHTAVSAYLNVGLCIHTCIYTHTMNLSVSWVWHESSTPGLLVLFVSIFATNSYHLSLTVENLTSIIQRPLLVQF